MANLVPLYEEAIQFNNFNGTVLAAGKVEVWYLGRTRKADIYADVAGETPLPNPFELNDLGMQEVYVNPAFNYTLVVYDPYGAELFSVDKYLQGAGGHTTSNVVVQPSEHIGVSAWTVGEVQIYQPYLVGEVGKTYEGIDPIVVNNTLNRISANHIPLGVQDPLYFVEDSETACIIGMSGGIVPEGTMVESSLGFENNKITGYNGSAFSAGNEYEAGNYISIDNNTLSVTGLSPVPADTASTGLVAEVSADIISQIPSTAGLATTAQLDEKLDKVDSANFYPMTGNPSGFLTAHQSLQGYATEQWVEGKGYLTSVDIPESAVWNATTQTVSANSAAWAGGTANPQIPVTGINGIKISESGDKVVFEVSANYATEDWVTGQGYLTAETDWTNTITAASANAYNEATAAIPAPFDPTYLSGQIDTKLDSAIYAAASGTFLTALPQDLVYTADIQDMATTGQVAEKLDTTAFSTVSGDFLTAVDLTPYQEKANMTAYQPVGSYLTADALDNVSANWNEVSAKLDTTAFSDVSGTFLTAHQSLADYQTTADMVNYQTTAGMTAYQPAGSYLTTADSANFYTTANESGFISEVPAGTMNESAFEYDENDKISGYNGSAFAGGSDVPEGVMVESGLEYNAVDEISGYNGSAFAQYGAEKQWLVHDDTLVHASNSAQYALGVNLSAVAQLLGVDETLLYSGATTWKSSITLTESPLNFSRIKVLFGNNLENTAVTEKLMGNIEFVPFTANNYLYLDGVLRGTSREWHAVSMWSGISGTSWSTVSGSLYGLGASTSNNNNLVCSPYLVIGIGRKQ